jgi:hypothetical protein
MRRSASRGRRPVLLLSVLALALLAAGCSRDSQGGQAAEAQATTTTAAGPTPATLPVVTSSDKGDVPGISVSINQLRRSDPNTVTLIFTIANKGTESFSYDWTWGEFGVVDIGDARTYDVSGVYLIEPVGKKKYLVLRDTEKRCVCTIGLVRAGESLKGIVPGQDTTLFAKFPAPPADVSKMSVVIPHFPVFDGVPLTS